MNRYLIICLVFFFILPLNVDAQAWRSELEKYEGLSFQEIDKKMESYFDAIGRDRSSKYKHYLRWANNARNHTNESGYLFNHSSVNNTLLERMNTQIKFNEKQTDQRHFHGYWTSMNPNNFQGENASKPFIGNITCMAKPSASSNIIYAGAASGGVWKSLDDGDSWDPLMDGMVQLGVSSIVVDYTNWNHIIVATGDADRNSIPSDGIYHSYDAGVTWSKAFDYGVTSNYYIYKIIQSQTKSNEYYLATRGEIAGLSRIQIDQPNFIITEVQDGPMFDVEYVPSSGEYFASSSSFLYRKDANGWENLNTSPNVSGLPNEDWDRTQIAISTSNPQVMYNLYTEQTGNQVAYALYRSQDGGDTWELKVDSSNAVNLVGAQSMGDLVLEVDPLDSDIVYIGGQFFYKSIDKGETWSLDMENLHADMHNMYFYGSSQYIGTDGGLSKRENSSSDWYSISEGLIATQFYNIDVDGNRIMGGTQDNGTMRWDIGDAIGDQIMGLDGFDCLFDRNDPEILYGSTQQLRRRSTDGGQSFSDLHNNGYKGPIKHWVGTTDTIISTENFIRVSLDNGETWNVTIDPFNDPNERTIGFSQCASNPDVVYVTSITGIYKSTNFTQLGAATWDTLTSNVTFSGTLEARDIVVNPSNPDIVWFARAGYKSTQIFQSVNGGDTWDAYSEEISSLPVYAMTFDDVNGDGLYIGTELGIYYRNSSMDEWIPFSNYLPRVIVQEIHLDNGYVYAGTYGRGIWRSSGYEACNYSLVLTQANDPTSFGPSGLQLHKATNVIYSDRIIQGGAGTDVTYQSGNFIDLLDGFHSTAQFKAAIGGCEE